MNFVELKNKIKFLAYHRFGQFQPIYDLSGYYYYRVIFIHIPKTGGVAMNRAFFNCLGGGHQSYRQYEHIFNESISKYFTFSIMRDPVDRFISAYNYLLAGGYGEEDREWGEQILIQKYENINNFIINGLDVEGFEKVHFKKQREFIIDNNNKVMPDYIGLFSKLDQEFKYISERIKFKGELMRRNEHLRPYRVVKDEINSRSLDILRDIYSDDYRIMKNIEKGRGYDT